MIGSERTVESAAFTASAHRVPVFVGSSAALRPARRFDAIILFHVLEHLSAPCEVLQHCEQALKPGGTLIVAVPNARSWQARIFGPTWFHLDVPRHLYHFSPASLSRALERVGLRPGSANFHSFEHDPFGWIQSLLNRAGFRQNQLTSALIGARTAECSSFRLGLMAAMALAIAIPSLVLSICSWMASAGAVMEVSARKPA